jgi:hypothetical protein
MNIYVESESLELPKSASVVLQGTMALSWDKVLRRRVVARRDAQRSSRKRALRMSSMMVRRSLVLSGVSLIVKGRSTPTIRGSAQRPICVLDSDEESEDEPLIRRVVPRVEFKVSTFDCSDSPMESSASGESSEGEECSEESEGASETESSESESEDE